MFNSSKNHSIQLWDRLKTISKLTISATSDNNPGNWNGQGSGLVTIATPNNTTIRFSESGNWTTDAGNNVNFSNLYRWSTNSGKFSILLEHLRHGEQNPVKLVELVSDSKYSWQSTSPHLCNRDSYSAKINLDSETVFMVWSIIGPTKNQTLQYQYC